MQYISDEFKETVLGEGNRQHGALVQVFDRTGASLLLEIDDTQRDPDNPAAISWELPVDASADCRRALTLVIPNPDGDYSQDESNPGGWVFAENNVIHIDSGYLLSAGWDLKDTFYGLIDKASMTTSIDGMPTVTVTARSIEKKALQSKFDVTTAYTDTPSESVDYAATANGGSATATSNVAVGDSLDTGARVILAQGYKTVLGIRSGCAIDTSSADISTGKESGMSASSFFGPGYEPSNLVDGNTVFGGGSAFASGNGAALPQWVQIDLGAIQTIYRFRWINNRTSDRLPKDYIVAVSQTGAFAGEETIVATATGNTTWATWVEHVFNAIPARYLRMTVSAISSGVYFEFAEWQIFSPGSDGLLDTSALHDGTSTPFVWAHVEDGLTLLEATFRLDLLASESLSSATPNLGAGTTCTALKTSTDGLSWASQPTAGAGAVTARFIELTVQASATSGSATITVNEVAIVAGAARPASSAIDGDNFTFWRPAASDVDRTLTINFGTPRTWNAAYIQIGANPIDVWGGVKFKLLNGDTGDVLTDRTDRFYSGLVECLPGTPSDGVFFYSPTQPAVQTVYAPTSITCSSIKLQITAAVGVTAIRTVEVFNITVNNHVTFLLGDMATQAGISKTRISNSKLYRSNITCDLGDDYLQRMKEITDAVAWEIYGDPTGYLIAKPFRYDPNSPVMTYKAGEANITSLAKNPNGEGIFNYIVVRSEQSDKTIIATAKDDALGSPTSTQRLGNRVKAITDNTILTQKAANQRALIELWKNTKWKAPISLEHAVANPAHEANDVVWVEEENTKTKAPYLLNAFTLTYTPEAFTMSLELNPVG